jgi:hypothetical protein
MSPEQQRIAIAKACGWKNFNSASHEGAIQYGQPPNTPYNSWELPDYLGDLNACHEMEELLDEGQKERFGFWINHLHPFADIHYSEKKKDIQLEVFSLVHATADQRAEAFLRTLGLWQENPTQPQ